MDSTKTNKNKKNIPEEVLDNINPKEEILYNMRVPYISKSTKTYSIAYIFVAMFGLIVMVFLLFYIGRDPDLDIFFIVLIFVLIGLVIFMSYEAIPSIHREIQYIIITDKKIYLQKYDRKERRQFFRLMENNLIIAVNYETRKKNKPDQRELGKIKIAGQEREIVIYDIPNIIENFKIIESIGYHYGNFKERGEKIKNKFKFPYEERNNGKVLVIDKNGVIYSEENRIENISFNETFCLNYSSKLTYSKLTKGVELMGTIFIKTSYPSPVTIKFKCKENFLEILEIISLHLTIWKEKKGLLFPKQKLTSIKKNGIEVSRSIKSLELEPTIKKEQLSSRISNLLKENEEILFHYVPKFKYTNNIIYIVSGIVIIILTIFQFTYMVITDSFFVSAGLFIGSVIIMIFLSFLCCFATCFLLIKIKSNKSYYIFTNQQLIMWFLGNFYFIPFSNIASLTHSEEKTGYNIEIKLKKSIPMRANPNSTEILIPIRPKDKKIVDKIKSFRNFI